MSVFKKMMLWYRRQDDTVKAFVWIGFVCIIGIILRWDYVVRGIQKGFEYYSNK